MQNNKCDITSTYIGLSANKVKKRIGTDKATNNEKLNQKKQIVWNM